MASKEALPPLEAIRVFDAIYQEASNNRNTAFIDYDKCLYFISQEILKCGSMLDLSTIKFFLDIQIKIESKSFILSLLSKTGSEIEINSYLEFFNKILQEQPELRFFGANFLSRTITEVFVLVTKPVKKLEVRMKEIGGQQFAKISIPSNSSDSFFF